MSFPTDFQMELMSQTSIVHYIEYQFEKELQSVTGFLNIKIVENLYDNNTKFMKALVSKCNNLKEQNSKLYIKERPLPSIAQNVDVREPVGEIITYCIECLDNDSKLNLKELQAELAETNKQNDENYYNFSEEQLKEIIDAAYIIYEYNKNNELEKQDNIVDLLKTTIKLVDNSSSSNIFRQSFINIFSIFDAYVFEHLKDYFYTHPNELETFLDLKTNDKIKITLEDTLSFSNIENLKYDMIQKQFSGKYLSEIIRKLKNYKVDLYKNIDYALLMEMIERRNIHLHNKGYVDEKYKNSFNIYKFNIGEYAYIDSEYLFIKVFNTLSQFATNFDKLFVSVATDT